VFLHMGIAFVSPGLTEFGLVMITANLAFFSGPWIRSLVTGTKQPVLRVLFDGACPRCRASMALVTAADPDQVLQPIDLTAVDVTSLHPSLSKKACMESMHVIDRQGRVTAGFDAVRSLCGWLLLCWPFFVFAWIPGVAWAGRRVYNYLAKSRPRDTPCTDDHCELHRPSRNATAKEFGQSSSPPASPRLIRPEETRQT
jgi:predicted DCC family thiol-disulfide oxidoreductase YuxK